VKLGPITACQICGAVDLRSALFLGFLPPVNSMRALGAPADAEPWFPAELLVCPRCHLAQLGYAVDPAILFPPEYPYTSGSTRVLRENFADLYREAQSRAGLGGDDLIVDIGSNDGTLLSNFAEGGHRVIGIEPTDTGELARERGIPTLQAYFDLGTAEKVLDEYGQPRLVTAANVFAHIPDVHAVVEAVERLVGTDAYFVTESHYLGDLVETLQYDTIYHEHLRYYSVTSILALLDAHGFKVVHVKRIPTHGGSIRVYATKADEAVDASVERILEEERRRGLADESWVGEFRRRVLETKLDLLALLRDLKHEGARIYGIGAPSRASTLVNFVGLDDGIVDCVLEISSSKKLDKYVPGTAIPVVDEQKLYDDQPEYALLLSWHIADELRENLLRNGFRGGFIVPLPEPRVVAPHVAAV
jgi:C-methyltransferase-like protein/methyltransferase family protein/putative zinc binding protein